MLKTLLKPIYLTLGWCLLVMGLLTWPLPVPVGLPLVLLGGVLVYSHSHWARRTIRWLRRNKRYPRLGALLCRFERRLRRVRRSHQ